MRVARYYNNRDVRLEEQPRPAIGAGELLVKVNASGICGSDVLEWYRIRKAPLVLGHEIAGEIAAVGAGVTDWAVGDRVFVSHHVPCNDCRYCRSGHHTACETLHTTNYDPGGFAEFLRVPAINLTCGVLKLPDQMTDEEGTFIEPLGCIVRGQRLAGLKPGQAVLVLGAGISGLLHLQLARARGAGRLIATDVHPYRLAAAARQEATALEATAPDLPGRIRAANGGRLADLAIVCTGAFSAFEQALASVDRGGTIMFFAATDPGVAVPVPANEFWRNEMKVVTSYGAAPGDLVEARDLIAAKKLPVTDLVTHRLPLAETGKGFALVAAAGESIKVIIQPHC